MRPVMNECATRMFTAVVEASASQKRPLRSEDRCRRTLLTPRMTELAFARLRTIVRLGEALPVVLFSSAVDFILPVIVPISATRESMCPMCNAAAR